MSRKSATSGDSLDLLLDTICNTFGGILFISMLVVILVNAASSEVTQSLPSEEDHQRLVEGRRRLSDTTVRLASLRRAARQIEQMRDRFSDPESAQVIEELQDVQGMNEAMHEARDSSLEELAAMQELINETAMENARMKAAIQVARQALQAAKSQLDAEVSLRSRTSKLPRQRRTTRQQAAFFLKGGKLCSFARIGIDGQLALNESEARVHEKDDRNFAEPVPGAGLAVRTDGSSVQAITEKISPFAKEKFFIAIVVWPDSFEHFQAVKESVVRSGHEYQLIPMAANEQVFIGEATEESLVQ